MSETWHLDREAINYVERVVLDLGWMWREKAVLDRGIDGEIEICTESKKPTGDLIAVQSKGGDSYFDRRLSDGRLTIRLKASHLAYWNSYALPVIVVGYLPRDRQAYWIYVQDYLQKHPETLESGREIIRVQVPSENVFRTGAEAVLASIPSQHRELILRRFPLGSQAFERLVREAEDADLDLEALVDKLRQHRRNRFRLEKSNQRLFSELEDHLFLVRSNLEKLSSDGAFLRPLSAELRLLVCSSSAGNDGLLIRLCDRLGVSDSVWLHVHGGVDVDNALMKGVRFHQSLPLRGGTSGDPRYEERFPAQPYSLRQLVKLDEAVYTLGRSVSFEQVIRKVAEQIGTADSDDGIDPILASIEEHSFNGHPRYFETLAFVADLTLEVGERVVAAAAEKGYSRRRRSGAVSILANVILRDRPLLTIPLLTIKSHRAAIVIEMGIGPDEFTAVVSKQGVPNIKLSLPLNWVEGDAAACSMVYDQSIRSLHLCGLDVQTAPVECDLGYVGGRDLSSIAVDPECAAYVLVQMVQVFDRGLSIQDVEELTEYVQRESPPTISSD